MVPHLLLQCLLLSYISGNVSAQFFASLFEGLFSRAASIPEVMEMKPLEFDSSLLSRDTKLNLDTYNTIDFNKKIDSDLSALWSHDQQLGGKIMETNLGGSEKKGDILPDKNDKGSDHSGTNEDEGNEKTQDKNKKSDDDDDDNHHHHPPHPPHPPHQDDKDDKESKKTKSHNNNELTFLSTTIQIVEPYTVENPLHEFTFYGIIVTIGVSIIAILYISFKKYRKPKQSDDIEPILL